MDGYDNVEWMVGDCLVSLCVLFGGVFEIFVVDVLICVFCLCVCLFC